jgi:5-methylcytosine-specific restriction enzyme A
VTGRWRTSDLPQDRAYLVVRNYVLRRDPFCRWGSLPDDRAGTDYRCPAPSDEVDHIGDPRNHDPSNLRGLCSEHHATRTGRQGAAARHALTPRRNRPTERHPGFK